MIFSCCTHYPHQNIIKELIKLNDTSETEQIELVQSIFSFEDQDSNCLFVMFDMMRGYRNRTDDFPDSSIELFNEFESLFIYMLQLAEQNDIDMDRLINYTNEGGQSLFYWASRYSNKISIELINRNVKVNRMDHKNTAPDFFRVSHMELLVSILGIYI